MNIQNSIKTELQGVVSEGLLAGSPPQDIFKKVKVDLKDDIALVLDPALAKIKAKEKPIRTFFFFTENPHIRFTIPFLERYHEFLSHLLMDRGYGVLLQDAAEPGSNVIKARGCATAQDLFIWMYRHLLLSAKRTKAVAILNQLLDAGVLEVAIKSSSFKKFEKTSLQDKESMLLVKVLLEF